MQEFKVGDKVVVTAGYPEIVKGTELTITDKCDEEPYTRYWFKEVHYFLYGSSLKHKESNQCQQRPHAALITKWANDTSVEIEFKGELGGWYSAATPCWGKNTAYREKVKDTYKDKDALAVTKAKEELTKAVENAPTTATHIYGDVFYKEGNLYALYYQKGWRESATLSNRKLLSEGTEVNVI